MSLVKFYKNSNINRHRDSDKFKKRLIDALVREKFKREDPINSTPTSVINCSKYILEFENKSVFICVPNFLFEETLNTMFGISKSLDDSKVDPKVLIEKTYNDEKLRSLKANWNQYSWTSDFETFFSHLVEESFLYFDDLSNQYYFNLFRGIKEQRFEGGILHALSRHFGEFTKFNSKPDLCSPFNYQNFMYSLILCCIHGEFVGEKVDKGNGNYQRNKQLDIGVKSLVTGLFWENNKELFFLNTFVLKSNK